MARNARSGALGLLAVLAFAQACVWSELVSHGRRLQFSGPVGEAGSKVFKKQQRVDLAWTQKAKTQNNSNATWKSVK